MSPDDGPLADDYRALDAPIDIIPSLKADAAAPSLYERDIVALSKAFAALDPDLIYANTIDSFPAIDAARAIGVASVWNIREGEPWRRRLADRHEGIAARALACFSYPWSVIFVSQATAAAWAQFTPADRSRVIYNGPGATLPRAISSFRDGSLVSIGTLCERKGQLDFVEAFARAAPRLPPEAAAILIGRPAAPYARALKAATPAALFDRVRFLGEQPDAASFLVNASALVHAARTEAFPRVLIEAAHYGAPIVTTAVGGVAERLVDGKSALFFRPGDIAGLTENIVRLFEDPGLAARLAAAAHQSLVMSWTQENMIDAYDREFRSALSAAAGVFV